MNTAKLAAAAASLDSSGGPAAAASTKNVATGAFVVLVVPKQQRQQQQQQQQQQSSSRAMMFQRKRSHLMNHRSPILGWVLSSALAFCLIQTFMCEFPESDTDNNKNHHKYSDQQLQTRFLHTEPTNTEQQQQKRRWPGQDPGGTAAAVSNQDDNKEREQRTADVSSSTRSTTTRTLTNVLQEAGIMELLSDQERSMLPLLEKTFRDLYGPFPDNNNNNQNTTATATVSGSSGPLIYGLETCEAYRALVPNPMDRFTGPAGMFNTGTNNLEVTLKNNLERGIPGAHYEGSVHYQVPWGKHRMARQRFHHVAPEAEEVNQTQCFPIVIIRDPYHWMQSMCVEWYAAEWKHNRGRCPNLVAAIRDKKHWSSVAWDKSKLHNKKKKNRKGGDHADEDDTDEDDDNKEETFQVKVEFDDRDVEFFDSLIDLWNDWYKPYWESTFPRLMIRQEDMLLHAPAIVQKVSECMGIPLKHPIDQFKYQTNTAKEHGSGTTLLKAIMKTADNKKRGEGLMLKDKTYAAQHLDSTLMKAFQYRPVID